MRKPAPALGELLDLTGKIALVTGASAGIGRGVAGRLSEAGAAVAVHYRTGREGALDRVEAIRRLGGKATAVQAELTDPASVEAAVAAVTDELGPIDLLVNNAARQNSCQFRGHEPR